MQESCNFAVEMLASIRADVPTDAEARFSAVITPVPMSDPRIKVRAM
jgi:hypothetical protein